MVTVIKRTGKKEAFKPAKIVKACVRAGCPEAIAKAMALEVAKKLRGKKTVKSSAIKAMLFAMMSKVTMAKKGWPAFERKKRAKKSHKKKAKKRR